MQVIVFAADVVEAVVGRVRVRHPIDQGDPRGAAFPRLHDAIRDGADRLALEVAVAEALCAFGAFDGRQGVTSRPVRRSLAYLRDRFADTVTLDDLVTHAGFDKFHVCRAFRAQAGVPPQAYLTRLRTQRAKELLTLGKRSSDVAPQVGFYDQSQLNRHFLRIVGITPGRYAGEARRGSAWI